MLAGESKSLCDYVQVDSFGIDLFQSVKSGTPLDFGKLLGCVSHVYQPMIVTPLFNRVRVVRVEISKCFILPSRNKVSLVYLHPENNHDNRKTNI